MQDKILALLKHKSDYISGEEIAHRLKVSRQALWKHIQDLRDTGYDIAAVPHLGYRLDGSPDRLLPSELTSDLSTKFIGRKIYYFDHLSSTMDIATQLGLKNASEGTIVVAEAQTKGRGRLGRSWLSPKYKGIYFSLILRPKTLLNITPVITLLSAVSICEAIKEVTGLDSQIKWPNDIFINNKKLAGILTEFSGTTDEASFVIIGIGLNVNNDKKSLLQNATSLKEQRKEPISRLDLLRSLLAIMEKNYLVFQREGSKPIIDKWRHHNLTLQRRIRVSYHNQHLEGTAVDIDIDGALLLRKDSGIVQRVTAGDITHCR